MIPDDPVRHDIHTYMYTVDFCGIGCVIATKFYGKTRMHVFSRTHKLFLEISPRDNLIKIINFFLMVPKSKLRNSCLLKGIN